MRNRTAHATILAAGVPFRHRLPGARRTLVKTVAPGAVLSKLIPTSGTVSFYKTGGGGGRTAGGMSQFRLCAVEDKGWLGAEPGFPRHVG